MRGNKIINCPSLGSGGDASLIEDITSNVDVGGAPSGTVFEKDLEFTDFAKRILRKTIIPDIRISVTGEGLHNIGDSVTDPTITATLANLSNVTVDLDEIQFKVDGTLVNTQPFAEGQNTYSYQYSVTISSNTTFSVSVKYDNTLTVSKSTSITFVNPSYYGFSNSLNPSEADIKSMASILKANKGYTWKNITMLDSRFCYAYPKTFGNLTSIKDKNNFEYINSYTLQVISVNSEDYNVYVLTEPVTISDGVQIYV